MIQREAAHLPGFSLAEAEAGTGLSTAALSSALRRAVQTGKLMPVMRGYYVCLSPVYRRYGRVPLELYVDGLFATLNRPYYVALHSAAAWHGAAHQRPQADALMTSLPSMRNWPPPAHVHLHATRQWPAFGLETRMTDGIPFRLSDPALTMADLVHFEAHIGGLNRQYTVIEELLEAVSPHQLKEVGKCYPHRVSLRRLGALLDAMTPGSPLANTLFEALPGPFPAALPLDKRRAWTADTAQNRWKIGLNADLESDL